MRSEKIKKCDDWINSFKSLFDTYNEIVNLDKYKSKIALFIHLDSYEIDNEKFFIVSINLEDTKTNKDVCEEVSLTLNEKYITEYMYIASNVISYYLKKVCNGKIVKQSDFYKPSIKKNLNSYLDISGLFDAKFTSKYNEILFFDDMLYILVEHSNRGLYEDNDLVFNLFKNAMDNNEFDENMDYSILTLKAQTTLSRKNTKYRSEPSSL